MGDLSIQRVAQQELVYIGLQNDHVVLHRKAVPQYKVPQSDISRKEL